VVRAVVEHMLTQLVQPHLLLLVQFKAMPAEVQSAAVLIAVELAVVELVRLGIIVLVQAM
jgi:hypothetical protein